MVGGSREGIYRPATEGEIADLVRLARSRGLPLRVRGAGHSVDPAIHTTPRAEGRPHAGIDVSLDLYAGISFDDERRRVTVQAGCRFGADPRERSGRATLEAGLCWQLEQRGWALPNLAGLTQQTVAGFLMTGSSGGSRLHALDEHVVGLRVVDGTGEVREYTLDSDPEGLRAACVSLGLLGVVSTVTFQCVERYDVAGEESIVAIGSAPFDLYADGEAGVEGYLERTEYARILWWPQPGVERLTIWSGRRVLGPPAAAPKPYVPLPTVAGSEVPAQVAAGFLLGVAGRRRRFGRGMAAAYGALIPEDRGAPQRFRDAWYRALPMDDAIDERFLPTGFTELWIPAEATGEAIRRLREHYARAGHAATGGYCVELYAARESEMWLSPGHGRPSTRLNFFWFEHNRGDPRRDYFPQFWDLLGDLDFRLHWGKHLMPDPARAAAHARGTYPRLGEFLELREELDPGRIFLSEYWRGQLGVAPRAGAGAAEDTARELLPVAGGSGAATRERRRGLRWPVLFGIEPSGPELERSAEFVIDTQRVMDTRAEDIYDEFVELREATEWLEYFRRSEVIEDLPGGERLFDEVFGFMTLRVRTLPESEPGRLWLASVEGCSMPLAERMYEELRLDPLPDGRTHLRWRIFYDPVWYMRPFHPVVRRFFVRWFRRAAERLDSHLATRA